MITDLDKKGYLRSELKAKQGEEERMHIMNVLRNVREVTRAFNMFFDMYAERVKPDSKQRLNKFLELNRPFGFTQENLIYLLCSEMIFVFVQNIEEFRSALLFAMKTPICYSVNRKRKRIDRRITLGRLLKSLKELGINKAEALNDIDYNLRNGLSHCLFWLEKTDDSKHPKLHLYYSEDVSFKRIHRISIADLYIKMRRQSIYTNCLLNVIGDWFG